MTIIQVKTADQVLSAVLVPKLAPHNRNSVKLTVDFDAAWNGYGKSAVFYTESNPQPYEKVLDASDACLVPPEVLTEPGYMFVTLKGVKTSDNSIKASARLKLKVSAGMPLFVVSEPTEDVYSQLLAAYSGTNEAIVVERARIDSLAKLKEGSTTGDAELILARTDFEGKTHGSLQTAINTNTKKLARGRYALAALLPSSTGGYPSISTAEKTFTVGEDTLLINDRVPGGVVSLRESNGNNKVTWGSEIASSAICFFYDIANDVLVARGYLDFNYNNDNLVLIATLRVRSKSQAICSCPIYVDGVLSTEVNDYTHTHFAAMLPPLDPYNKELYPKVSRADKTFTIPHDTLIIDNQFSGNYESIKTNNSVYYGDVVSSAVCIYYDIAGKVLVAKAFAEVVSPHKYLLICTIRDASDSESCFMAYASCPVWLDDRLSTETHGMSDMAKRENTNIKAVNHRGYNTEAPENTLSAFRLSKKNGFTYVECDVSFTSDGVAVLLHDSTIDRTSNGTGSINALTFNAVRALDFGSWKSEKYAGEKIPSFEEFIVLCRNLGLHPYIELKEGTENQIKSLVTVVRRYGMKGKVTWISFNATYLAYIKAVDPKARLGYVVDSVDANTIGVIQKELQSGNNEVFIDCNHGNVSTATVQLCVDADIPLEVWTVNDKDGMLALDAYVIGFTSDNLNAGALFYDDSIGG